MSERTIEEQLRECAEAWASSGAPLHSLLSDAASNIRALESAREQDRATLARVEAVAREMADVNTLANGGMTLRDQPLAHFTRRLRAALAPQGDGEREGG